LSEVQVFAKVLSEVLFAYHIPTSNSVFEGQKERQLAGVDSGFWNHQLQKFL
jgi:hypothetical protein